MRIFAIVFLYLLLLTHKSEAHKFYTSVTQMEFNENEKSFQITMNVFIDDLEIALTQANHQQVKWSNDQPELNKKLLQYLTNHFIVSINQQTIKQINLIGTQEQKDLLTIYFEIPFNKKVAEFAIENTFFLDLFPTQTNMVNLTYFNKKHSFLFQKNQTKQFFTIN